MSRASFPAEMNRRYKTLIYGACSARSMGTWARSSEMFAGRVPNSRGPHVARDHVWDSSSIVWQTYNILCGKPGALSTLPEFRRKEGVK